MNNKKNIKRVYNIVIIALMVLALGYVCSRFIHWGNVEYTDDAQVWRQPGQQLARIVDDNDVWVVANSRETQMEHISVGNRVEFTADAIPGVKYAGEVEAVAGGTGSAFSMIPVDNATGNFVKVEQRVPVRIRLTKENKAEDVARLLAGLNVETEVMY